MTAATNPQPASVDPDEIAHFSAMAERWWDPRGPFRPLHLLNPARLSYLVTHISAHHGCNTARAPFTGLKLLDIGCGGGLLAEPMARLGAAVTGIDAAGKNVAVARLHAEKSGLTIDYRATSAEALAETGRTFDVVLAMEVIEHVADVDSFLDAASHLLAPGGLVILSTLNRTAKAFAAAIIGAEYVFRWIPRGTHDWKKFLTPAELATALEAADLAVSDTAGMKYHPLTSRWAIDAGDLSVNYMMTAAHRAAQA